MSINREDPFQSEFQTNVVHSLVQSDSKSTFFSYFVLFLLSTVSLHSTFSISILYMAPLMKSLVRCDHILNGFAPFLQKRHNQAHQTEDSGVPSGFEHIWRCSLLSAYANPSNLVCGMKSFLFAKAHFVQQNWSVQFSALTSFPSLNEEIIYFICVCHPSA